MACKAISPGLSLGWGAEDGGKCVCMYGKLLKNSIYN